MLTAKYSTRGRFFITATNFGEVKVWDRHNLFQLGTVNKNDVDVKFLKNYILGVNKARFGDNTGV